MKITLVDLFIIKIYVLSAHSYTFLKKKKEFFVFGCLKNDNIFQHNGFINVDKKCLDTFLSKKTRL